SKKLGFNDLNYNSFQRKFTAGKNPGLTFGVLQPLLEQGRINGTPAKSNTKISTLIAPVFNGR
ncbi:hypothetical protein, partial [Escherichia coli]|uniref:hypothetical protein n=1 Tax=Escherichia coli TaxID=562 RepID=UPI0028DF31AD